METIKIRIPLNVTIPVTEPMAVEQLNSAIDKLIKVGSLKGDPSKFLLNYEIKDWNSENCIIFEIDKEALVDVAPFTTVGGGLVLDDNKLNWRDSKVELPKTFSVTTVNDRIRQQKYPIRQRLKLIIRDYQQYWKQKKEKLSKDAEQVKQLVQLFLSDLMILFNQVLPEIQEGKQLQSLLGLSQVSQGLNNISRDLSLAYRKALKQEEAQGAPSKTTYQLLSQKYREFLTELIPVVFEGINLNINTNETTEPQETEKTTEYSRTSDGRIDLFSKRTIRDLQKDEELQNKVFEELKRKWGDKFDTMSFDEIYIEVQKEFWKRKKK